MARTRTRNKYFSGRIVYTDYPGPTVTIRNKLVSAQEKCIDTVHPGPPFVAEDNLFVRRYSGQPARINGSRISGPDVCVFHNVPFVPFTNNDTTDMWSFPLTGWKNEALASIQDSAPEVDIPLNVAELKDLPRTVRSLFSRRRLSPGRANDLYLTTQFGVLPLVGVVSDLLNLQKSIANRVAQHRAKYRKRRARGTLSKSAIFFWSSTSTGGGNFYDWAGNVNLSSSTTISHRAWWTARLTPVQPLSETLANVVDNPLGIGEASPETLWNLIPWSFLIDYFADVSDVLRVTGNAMPYHVDSLCLMCTTTQTLESNPIWKSWFNASWNPTPGRETFTEKWRWKYSNPTAQLALTPFLSGTQLANIASLAASLNGVR